MQKDSHRVIGVEIWLIYGCHLIHRPQGIMFHYTKLIDGKQVRLGTMALTH